MQFNTKKTKPLHLDLIDGGDFFYVKLTQGQLAEIDKRDWNKLKKYNWLYRKSGRTDGKNGYAQSGLVFMHNIIMKPKKGLVVDHIDSDGLNNRRSNLRVVTKSQNAHNVIRKNKTGYRGVRKKKGLKQKPYEAQIKFEGKVRYIGIYSTAEEAGLAYNKKAKELFGDVAILNKI